MCVCKQWKSFISTRELRMKNLQHITNDQSLTHHKFLVIWPSHTFSTSDVEDLCNPDTTIRRYVPIFFPGLTGGLKVVTIVSLDGPVFVELPETSEFPFLNPLTSAYKKFKSNYPRSYTKFDAFYFDSFNNDYKVLQVISKGGLHAYIFSQKYDSWKTIMWLENHQWLSNSESLWSNPIFLGQRIYFMVRDSKITVLIVFDVKSEKFREIGVSMATPNYARAFMSLVVLKGCIHVCVAYPICSNGLYNIDENNILNCELWKMDGDGDGWTKLATFSQKHDNWMVYPTRNGNWLGIWKDEYVFCKIDLEDLPRNILTTLDTSWIRSTTRMLYVETLVSPGS
ncbi:F-box domain containing protein [Tanacetum coccineum]